MRSIISAAAANSICFLSAGTLLESYGQKTLSPVEAVRAVLDRIERHDGAVNAFCHLDAAGALKSAAESEARWRSGAPKSAVDGVPIGVKDNILVAGMPTRFGSTLSAEKPSAYDAPAVARLREQGAIVIGKTTLPEFGWKAVTDSPLTGVTRNPWDLRKTPGGSSGGAVAALLLGMGVIHLGTDGGGSIRIPAAFSGCYGIKPTRARVPAWPAAPLGTLAHVGPLTRSVADAAAALAIMATPDPRDVHGWPTRPPDYARGLDDGIRGVRVAYSPRLGYVGRIDPDVEAAASAAARTFAALGAHVEEADPDIGGDPVETWETLWWSAAATILEPYGERARQACDPGLIEGAARGARMSAVDYLKAQIQRAKIANAFARFFQRYDLLLTPAVAVPAFETGRAVPQSWDGQWTGWAPFSYPFNLTQQPAASVPCGTTPDGLPIGLQIVGALDADGLVLRASRAFETARPFTAALEEPRAG